MYQPRFKAQNSKAKIPVYLTCGKKRAEYIASNGITGSCDIMGKSDQDFFEERKKCSFAWLSLEQARYSSFGNMIFEVLVDPEDIYVADLSAACDLFSNISFIHTGEVSVEKIRIYRKSIQRLSEYLARGNVNPEEIEIIIANPVSVKDIKFVESRPLLS